jgi:hypothetical protein
LLGEAGTGEALQEPDFFLENSEDIGARGLKFASIALGGIESKGERIVLLEPVRVKLTEIAN